jgi:hypothetical protein
MPFFLSLFLSGRGCCECASLSFLSFSAGCVLRISPGTQQRWLFKKENGAINKLLKRLGLSPPHDFSPVNSETLFAVFAAR